MLGLCICYYNHNYGSMLQAYATVKEIEKRGIPFKIIGYKKKKTPLFLIKNSTRVFNKTWRSEKKLAIQKKISCKTHKKYAENTYIRNKMFSDFQNKYFEKDVFVCFGYEDLCKKTTNFDKFLVGSDQMWSPSGLATNFYNLMFVPENIRKISYASSFGVSSIPKYQLKRTKEYLERIEFLSVREQSAKNIIKDLTNRDDAIVSVDPTMLLNKVEWDEFSGLEKIVETPYIFAYFLGNNQEHRIKVNELSEKTGLKVVTLRHLDEYIKSDEVFGNFSPYDIGPCEFINLIKNADFVCTDSFHGTVFSSLFHKQFLTFSRYKNTSSTSKNSRIESLLNLLGLEERHYIDGDVFEIINKKINYDLVEVKRDLLIKKSKDFLDKALKN